MSLKIISFSLFGNQECYREGVLVNIKAAKEHFPDWVCRFYVDETLFDEVAEQIIEHGGDVVSCQTNTSGEGLFWRFYAADDLSADAVIVRDTDSVLCARDKSAVDEWLKSGKKFHIIRDHPSHRAPIQGGLWGIRPGLIDNMTGLIEAYFSSSIKLGYGVDQTFLANIIYSKVLHDAFIHSEYTQFKNENVSTIDVARDGMQWLGMTYNRPEELRLAKKLYSKNDSEFGVLQYRVGAVFHYNLMNSLSTLYHRYPKHRIWVVRFKRIIRKKILTY